MELSGVESLGELFGSELKLSFLLRRKPLMNKTKIARLESAIKEYTTVSENVYSS